MPQAHQQGTSQQQQYPPSSNYGGYPGYTPASQTGGYSQQQPTAQQQQAYGAYGQQLPQQVPQQPQQVPQQPQQVPQQPQQVPQQQGYGMPGQAGNPYTRPSYGRPGVGHQQPGPGYKWVW